MIMILEYDHVSETDHDNALACLFSLRIGVVSGHDFIDIAYP